MLCEICVGALHHRKGWVRNDGDDAEDPHVLLAHHTSAASLESSAREACEMCYPFWSQFTDEEQTRMREMDTQWTSRHEPIPRQPGARLDGFIGLVTICAAVNIGKDAAQESAGLDVFISVSFETEYRDGIPELRDLSKTFVMLRGPGRESEMMVPFSSTSTASADSWRQVTKWMQLCTSSHSACNVEAATGWHPTRLLDLANPESSLDTFRVVVTKSLDLRATARYTTLSHCWGTAQFLQLRKSTFDELTAGIKLDRLPKTFREAMRVTRQLGVRYLWIDSLCIMQDRDDMSDWLIEAGQMHKVYTHSYCNISAAGAVDSSRGLFFDRDPQLSHSGEVRMCVEGLGLSPDGGVDYIDCSIVDINFWGNSIGKCPLNTRGWVLQERLLSPRVLHFAKNQLFWECREHSAAECYPDRLPRSVRNSLPAMFKKLDPASRSKNLHRRGGNGDESMFYHQVWNSIVRAYSATRLTHGSDKLIALSGVAKYFAPRIGDVYVVGMWRKYLASSLLWHVKDEAQGDGSASNRPEVYRAPSFSWASVDGQVVTEPPAHPDLLLFKVVDFHLDYVSADTTGLVKSGYIDIRGQVRPFEMLVKYTLQLQQLYMVVNGVTVKDPTKQEWDNGPLVHLDVGQQSFVAENADNLLFYLPARKQRTFEEHVSFILLAALDPSQAIFRRIGLAVATNNTEVQMLSRDAICGSKEVDNMENNKGYVRTIRII
ncbi:HET domain-containing protein [Microdochium nivale]|nr:HET domain-containing protein [Microdochium nivale]